ncbi:MAG TPA: hypothetical protein H9931_07395 [Candidatus Enterocloster excrementigallinarum]|uniref:Uncharacterized protein n=1 Tax=Candidatus Enterocloster excrementigallinarum TaxID=2838558 RepID=A0A9D2PTR0_9FIRM|nr:hypothetical protein [Candidatus Enterocloster excrementigallinarum]
MDFILLWRNHSVLFVYFPVWAGKEGFILKIWKGEVVKNADDFEGRGEKIRCRFSINGRKNPYNINIMHKRC